MKKQDKTAKKKRTILAVSAVGVLVLVGGVIAYNRNQQFFNNLFHLGSTDDESYVEVFDSPQNWACQEETPKSVHYENGTGYTRAVRVKYEDYWKRKNSTSTDHQTELPKEKDGKSLTKINFQNESDWILNADGWYYYRFEVPDGAQTSEFMESVVFDCNFEETEEYECTTTATGKECESGESDYMDATYHIFITIEATTEPETDNWPYTPVPTRQTLYDTIAAQTQGVDTNVDFSKYASSDDPDYNGVNTLAAHKDDKYPVYYFRGAVDNNMVAFGAFCWRIVRTAENGSTKMVFAGPKLGDGTCAEDGTPQNTAANNGQTVRFNKPSSNMQNFGTDVYWHAQTGYTYGKNDYVWYNFAPTGSGDATSPYRVAKDVEYKNGRYRLKNAKTIDAAKAELGETYNVIGNNAYHYWCAAENDISYYDPVRDTFYRDTSRTPTSCEDVMYAFSGANRYAYNASLRLSGGDKIEDVMRKTEESQNDSEMKKAMDSWYETWILQQGESENLKGKLVDVSFCNDRKFSYAGIPGSRMTNSMPLYEGWTRLSGMLNNDQPQPSVDCARREDSYTVSSLKGNGNLKYPVGMLTSDEYHLAGISICGSNYGIDNRSGEDTGYIEGVTYQTQCSVTGSNEPDNYLWMDGDVITPTSAVLSAGMPFMFYANKYIQNFESAWGVNVYFRPVIALKYRTYIKSGTGSKTDPYVLEWDS